MAPHVLTCNAFVGYFICVLYLFASVSHSLTAAQWRSQSIYQVLTDRFARTDGSTTASCNLGSYCGGTWKGLINRLDYIQNMGFTAIWISPVVKNIQKSSKYGAPYHGYWATDIYQINTNFGSATDLVTLSNALHSRGMYLMVDVVTNHMAYDGCRDCVNYSTFNPFNEQSYYHTPCSVDYDNTTSIEQCWVGDNILALPDLRTEDSTVAKMWQVWIKQLVANYTIDGLRIDSARSVDQAFYPPFKSAAGVFATGEVFDGNPYTFCPYQNYMDGMLNFPAYFWITQAFKATTGSISNLVSGINTMIATCGDTTLLGSFVENHDVARFPSYTSDMSLTKNAIGFTMLADGMPIIYQGQEQHFSGASDPSNREALWLSGYPTTATLYQYIAKLNNIRKQAIGRDAGYVTSKATPIYSDSSTIVMSKGSTGSKVVAVFNNKGSSGSSVFILPSSKSGFTSGQSLTDLISCTAFATDSNGDLMVSIINGLPLVFYPTAQISGSGICDVLNASLSVTTSKSATKTSSTLATQVAQRSSTSSTTLSTSVLKTSTKSSTTSCVVPTVVPITFEEEVTTEYGQTIKLVGSVSQLGSWDPRKAITLSAEDYTECDPYWFKTVQLPAGAVVQYKYINIAGDGTVIWEADPNHTYTVPSGCKATAAVVSDTWQ